MLVRFMTTKVQRPTNASQSAGMAPKIAQRGTEANTRQKSQCDSLATAFHKVVGMRRIQRDMFQASLEAAERLNAGKEGWKMIAF